MACRERIPREITLSYCLTKSTTVYQLIRAQLLKVYMRQGLQCYLSINYCKLSLIIFYLDFIQLTSSEITRQTFRNVSGQHVLLLMNSASDGFEPPAYCVSLIAGNLLIVVRIKLIRLSQHMSPISTI